jgi:TfoX/Sxy family transcriptional regulator of competence genes
MHYDISLANRVRAALAGRKGVVEKEMLGGLGFLLNEHMFCGIAGDRLVVRLEPSLYEEALQEPGVSATDHAGRATPDHVYISQATLSGEEILRMWLDRGMECVSRMPGRKAPIVKRVPKGKPPRPRVDPGPSSIRRIPRSGPPR